MIRVSVLYPNEAGKRFDVDYYRNTHMKLVADRLRDYGFVRAEVDRGVAGGAPGSPAPYVCVGHVYVQSLADFQRGMGVHGKEIMGDIPNYTDIRPTMQIGEMIA
jgi:uncharacterized protein (TIGR02118 family)